jgi:hypothetical protein
MDQEGLKKLEELFESKNDWRANHRKSESGGAEEEEDSVFDIRKYEGCGIKGQEEEGAEGDWVVEDGKKAKKHKSQRS